jgi:hypothetical protein
MKRAPLRVRFRNERLGSRACGNPRALHPTLERLARQASLLESARRAIDESARLKRLSSEGLAETKRILNTQAHGRSVDALARRWPFSTGIDAPAR